jgi:hypothetical protein
MVLNSLELREYNLGVIVLISLLSSRCRSAVVVIVLKSVLGRSSKVNDSIKDSFNGRFSIHNLHVFKQCSN